MSEGINGFRLVELWAGPLDGETQYAIHGALTLYITRGMTRHCYHQIGACRYQWAGSEIVFAGAA